MAVAWDATLVYLRDRPHTLATVLAVANLLSALDLALTLSLFRFGVIEGNPLMASLFRVGIGEAAVVKAGLVAVAALGIWALRRHRSAIVAAIFFVTVYGVVVLCELVGLASLR